MTRPGVAFAHINGIRLVEFAEYVYYGLLPGMITQIHLQQIRSYCNKEYISSRMPFDVLETFYSSINER